MNPFLRLHNYLIRKKDEANQQETPPTRDDISLQSALQQRNKYLNMFKEVQCNSSEKLVKELIVQYPSICINTEDEEILFEKTKVSISKVQKKLDEVKDIVFSNRKTQDKQDFWENLADLEQRVSFYNNLIIYELNLYYRICCTLKRN